MTLLHLTAGSAGRGVRRCIWSTSRVIALDRRFGAAQLYSCSAPWRMSEPPPILHRGRRAAVDRRRKGGPRLSKESEGYLVSVISRMLY